MNQNKKVLWIALIGVAVVLVVAFLLSNKPGGGSGLPNDISSEKVEPFPKGTPPLAPAVPVLPPEGTPSSEPPITVPPAEPAPPASTPSEPATPNAEK